jgi:uncharacterized protein (DUF952 family)
VLTYHALAEEDWRALAPGAAYEPASLSTQGFIHTTIGGPALQRVLNAFYRRDPRPYVALLIELDRVTAPWDLTHSDELDADFPHIHGPLNRDAVIGVVPLGRADDGSFQAPPSREQSDPADR